MTLVGMWIRQNESLKELVVASDSRLSGGESWDACPKIISLPRPATIIAMSGDAVEAYAFLLQAINTCLLLDGNTSGRTDIGYLARKLRDVYADIRNHVKDLPQQVTSADVPQLDVVLAGWSWRRLRFEAYSYRYRPNGDLQIKPLSILDGERSFGIYFFGDAGGRATKALSTLLDKRGLIDLKNPVTHQESPEEVKYLDWQPLEIIESFIGDSAERTVGGVPQVTRIYQYGEAEPFVWRRSDESYHFGGRPIQDKERFDRRVMSFSGGIMDISFSPLSM